jgi:hypothetical protein
MFDHDNIMRFNRKKQAFQDCVLAGFFGYLGSKTAVEGGAA